MSTSLTTVPPSTVPPALLRLPAVGPALMSLERRLSAPGSMRLSDTLVELFLKRVIDERAKDLATLAGKDVADVLPLVRTTYLKRLADQIGQAAKKADARAVPRVESLSFEKRLSALYLPQAAREDFTSAARFAALLGRSRVDLTWRGGVRRSPVSVRERTLVGAIMLRAIQTVALETIKDDYPATALARQVPVGVENALVSLLDGLDACGRAIGASAGLVPLSLAQAQMQWALACAEDRIWLPLRAIPTAPLADDDLANHYVGRSDDDARRLGQQIRRADGAILVSGYRGVGKSTFVNRVLYHALRDQASGESNGKIVVPVTINLAKVAGVNNVLRLTLRGLRAALLDATGTALPIPADELRRPLPLRAGEREQLEWAYVRSTWKVAFTRARTEENSWELGTSVGFDPGKLAHWELGKLFSASAHRSRNERVNRELSLLDYDENAAEEDLQDLIRRFAEPRPLVPGGPSVGLKLVFIFDELDKMDQEKGVLPLIEGLKNLFLQQHAVFVLVTSKQLYYSLLKDRVKEDATLTSYFSSLVHVPLLDFAQVRRMLDDWIDATIAGPATARTERQKLLLDQLARYLTYRSLGNPREIIRELREMQHWGNANGPSYLTDALLQAPQLVLFAEIQKSIELVARPSAAEKTETSVDGVALASDRLSGDEARLEQVRRGLYVLVEELLDRQTLRLEPSTLEPIRESNFALLSTAEVRQLANRLGEQLTTLHQNLPADTFAAFPDKSPVPLFTKETQEMGGDRVVAIRTSGDFYALSGRQAMFSADGPTTQSTTLSEAELLDTAEGLAAAKKENWAEWLTALGIMRQISPTKWSAPLEKLLLTVAQDADPQKRATAIGLLLLRPDVLFDNDAFDVAQLFRSESEEPLRTQLISMAGWATTAAQRRRATDGILALLQRGN